MQNFVNTSTFSGGIKFSFRVYEPKKAKNFLVRGLNKSNKAGRFGNAHRRNIH